MDAISAAAAAIIQTYARAKREFHTRTRFLPFLCRKPKQHGNGEMKGKRMEGEGRRRDIRNKRAGARNLGMNIECSLPRR